MDVSDASYYIFNEKGNKGSQMGHTKKFKKKMLNFPKYFKLKKLPKLQNGEMWKEV
jgi:hypothetical protein